MNLPVVRLGGPNSYCSGVLVAPDLAPAVAARTRLVLTCAHFWHDAQPPFRVQGGGFTAQVTAARAIDGTDLALALLDAPAPPRPLPGLSRAMPPLGARVTTHGFGGRARVSTPREGVVVSPLPWSVSKDFRTVVRHGFAVRNVPRAIKGDSGGPVMWDGAVAAVQSLIVDPFGRNLGIATVAAVGLHIPAIRRAADALV